MHDYFTPAVSDARRYAAESRAASHRAHVARGSDLRGRVARPVLRWAEDACTRLTARRDDAADTLTRPLSTTASSRVRHA